MHVQLALLVGCLHIVSPTAGRFEVVDRLGKAPDDLQYAFVICRHGITSPNNNVYGSEEEFSKIWPEGKGALTEDGERLMYLVGRSLRSRYEYLVPDYSQDRVEVTSSEDLRATLSTYAVAAGMFPPGETVIPDIPNWQPVPVFHNTGYDKAHLFQENKEDTSCPRYTKIRDTIVEEERKKLSWSHKNNIEKINKELKNAHSQMPRIYTLDDLFNVWDIYFTEGLSERNTQPWIPGVQMMQQMTQLAQFRLWSRMNGKKDGQNSILQYFTGPILNKVFKEVIQQQAECLYSLMLGTSSRPEDCFRLHIHGSLDLTVDALVWALVDQNTFMAYPGDTVILEVNRYSQVKLFLYSPMKPGKKLIELPLKNLCKQKTCTVEQAIKGLRDLGLVYSEDEWKQRCSNVEGTESAKWRESSPPKTIT